MFRWTERTTGVKDGFVVVRMKIPHHMFEAMEGRFVRGSIESSQSCHCEGDVRTCPLLDMEELTNGRPIFTMVLVFVMW